MTESLSIESLVEADVLVAADDGAFSLAPAFREAVAGYEAASRGVLAGVLEDRFAADEVDSVLRVEDEAEDARFGARLCALADRLEDVPFEGAVTAGLLVDQFVDDPIPGEGVPAGFVPVRGRRLGVVRATFPRAVVYVWRRDCEPCDAMRETLEDVRPRFPEDVARFAVYGPNAARYLHEALDVQGGPATLFFADGDVQSRLYGAQYEAVVESELAAFEE